MRASLFPLQRPRSFSPSLTLAPRGAPHLLCVYGPSSKHIKLTVNKNEQMFAWRRLFFPPPSRLLSVGAAASPAFPSVSSYLCPRSSIIFPLPVSFSDTHYLLLPVYMQRTHPSLPVQYAQDISAVCVSAPSWPADTSSYQPTGETQTLFRRG